MLDKIKAAGGTVKLIDGKPIALKPPVLRFKMINPSVGASVRIYETDAATRPTHRYRWRDVLIGRCEDDARTQHMKIYAQ